MKFIQLSKFYKVVSDKFVLKCKSLKIVPGIYQIRGENGSGKSIFLKYLIQLISSSDSMVQSNCKKILYLTNEEITFPNLTVKENLMLSYFLFKIKDSINTELIPEEHLETLCKNASLGTRQKVGLSLAMVGNFWDLIILDEAFSNLDSNTMYKFLNSIDERVHEGTIVLFVEHQVDFSDYSCFKNLKSIYVRQGDIYEAR
ncbi:ATP-binding cassette domain-containing protein [Streptococcus danieliae]|uniref:ATP-binding cassette domain-containing protein n=1 Tax=Streptococcus danieliae TaxID=747656 RepID=A0A7Z0S542_9STRE|nr:ATP-binding cassette domain-containing protein [Streptococcus danieliae]MBF0699531.1 ATP-binding cassette domain-containing protein [Streptococcus danieliae]NYS96707.1 ATP-binding cassette domain-containing protein [Streptococcus danieliae]